MVSANANAIATTLTRLDFKFAVPDGVAHCNASSSLDGVGLRPSTGVVAAFLATDAMLLAPLIGIRTVSIVFADCL
jgi:hypothetical protein